MDQNIKIVYQKDPVWEVIGQGITDFNKEKAGDDHGKNLCFVLKNEQDEILGGVIGMTFWNWLYINLMWIREDLRGHGFGHQLLIAAEEEALKRGSTYAYLDTFSFQAPEFYKKYGYLEFGRLEDFPPGHTRYFLMKNL